MTLARVRSHLVTLGWFLVGVAEVQALQCLCCFYKRARARQQVRSRLTSPYREPSI